jgi:hypothetical protein
MSKTHLFNNLNYETYNIQHGINKIVDIDLKEYGDVDTKLRRPTYYSVDPTHQDPYTPDLDDLVRLHYLVKTRKVTTVLEFGIGKSTLVLASALAQNKIDHSEKVSHLRRSNPFELHSIENNIGWIEHTKNNIKDKLGDSSQLVNLHYCSLEIGDFNGRMCSYYHNMPNICPDLIYLDGPDQFSAGGSLRGLGTNHPDRMPMAADILTIEHFLCPGTLIVLDGRTANARFLKCNLQRNWSHCHDSELDQHFFELIEEPLGPYNSDHIDFALGKGWYENSKHLLK